MGSEDYDPLKKPSHQNTAVKSKIKVLILLVLTNSLSIFLCSGYGSAFGVKFWQYTPSIHVWDSEKLIIELNATRVRLSDSQSQLLALRSQLSTANSLLETLIADTTRLDPGLKNKPTGMWAREPSEELKLAMGPHKLPLGFTPNIGSDELYPTLGQACHKFQDEVEQYLDYTVGGECPSDEVFAQRLMLKGCEPLPRRRCKPRTPAGYVEPHPYPKSQWSIPPDTSITWDAYTCKSYSCLIDRGNHPGSYDCKDCFNLFGREKDRWMHETSELDYSIDGVLAMKPKGQCISCGTFTR
jgi:hypothetical protein